jgi:hypothetical protein
VSIDSWAFNSAPDGTLIPSGWTRDDRGTFVLGQRAKIDVYQVLSSRNGGEDISADTY